MLCKLDIQALAASNMTKKNAPAAPMPESVDRRLHRWTTPPRLVCGVHTLASRSGRRSRRLIPNVGHLGRGQSNKCNGKLLQIPPSENHTRSGVRTSLGSRASPETRLLRGGSSFVLLRRDQSTA